MLAIKWLLFSEKSILHFFSNLQLLNKITKSLKSKYVKSNYKWKKSKSNCNKKHYQKIPYIQLKPALKRTSFTTVVSIQGQWKVDDTHSA